MRSYRLMVAAALMVAGMAVVSCGERAPMGPTAETGAAPLFGQYLPSLLACTPMAADSVTQVIGPEGGVLVVGAHVLRIPDGALDSPVTITAVAPSDTVNRVVLSPHGLELEESAWLTLSYANCGPVSWFLPKRIAYTTDLLDIIEILFSFDNPFSKRVTGRLDHFSTYAVAW